MGAWTKEKFGYPSQTWDSARSQARGILIDWARQRRVGTYGQLCEALAKFSSLPDFQAHDQRLWVLLGQISLSEHKDGRPLLSAIVMHKQGDMRPGSGFFELAESLGVTGSDVDEMWLKALDEVWDYWSVKHP